MSDNKILNEDAYRVINSLNQIRFSLEQRTLKFEHNNPDFTMVWPEDLKSAIVVLRGLQLSEANLTKLREKYAEPMGQLEQGFTVDASWHSGILRSSKEVTRLTDVNGQNPHYEIWHGISDHFEDFSEAGLFEMWEGVRSPWQGDLTDDDTNANEADESSDDEEDD